MWQDPAELRTNTRVVTAATAGIDPKKNIIFNKGNPDHTELTWSLTGGTFRG